MWVCSHLLLEPGGKYCKIQHNLLCHCDQKNVSRWCCWVPGTPAKINKKPVRRWRHVTGTHHVTVDLIGQDGNAVFGGHWGQKNKMCFDRFLLIKKMFFFLSPTFENFLQVLLGEDGAARVGWVRDYQAGGSLVNQALQMLEVNLPRFFRLQEKTCTSAERHTATGRERPPHNLAKSFIFCRTPVILIHVCVTADWLCKPVWN